MGANIAKRPSIRVTFYRLVVLKEKSGFLGHATNNVAEYKAIINALEDAKTMTKGVEVYFSVGFQLILVIFRKRELN